MFQLQKRLPKWRQRFIKNDFKTRFLVKKINILLSLDPPKFLFKFHQHVIQMSFFKRIVSKDFGLGMSVYISSGNTDEF